MNTKRRPDSRGAVAIGLFLLTLFGLNDGLGAGEVADTTTVNRSPGANASEPSGSASEATVNAPGDGFLALRSEPSTKRGRRLAKIPHGTRLRLKSCDVAADGYHWCRTTYQGQRGWVANRYLSRDGVGAEGEILSAVAGACPADWCEASVDKVIGGYASVLLHCKKPNCDSILAFLKRSKGEWTLVDFGSGLTAEDLVGYGFPADVAEQLAY